MFRGSIYKCIQCLHPSNKSSFFFNTSRQCSYNGSLIYFSQLVHQALPGLQYKKSLLAQNHQLLRHKSSETLFKRKIKDWKATINDDESYINKKFKQFRIIGYPTKNLNLCGLEFYTKIAIHVKSEYFFKVLKLPDTFYSYVALIQLHVWMISVRLMDASEDGKIARYSLISSMWDDIEDRLKVLEGIAVTDRKDHLQSLGGQFNTMLLAFDEGITHNDTVLASAIWRYLYDCQCDDPELLENCVAYIRYQVSMLDKLTDVELFEKRKILLANFEDIRI